MQYIFPKRIISDQGVENADSLLKEKTLQIGLNEPDVAVMLDDSYIILDYGKEVSGGVRILTFFARQANKIRLRFGESVAETCAECNVDGFKKATNDHSIRDFTVDLQNYSDMTFGQTGFRFLRIDSLDKGGRLVIKSAVAAVDTDTRAQLGSFVCNDTLVNEIFDTAAYTLRLCMQNGYIWDGIKRDRLVWIGDLYPEMRAAHCLFGDIPETANCLEFAMQQTPMPNYVQGIPAYSLWWLIVLADEFKISGDKAKFEKFLPYAEQVAAHFSAKVQPNGKVDYGFNFIDWPSNYVEGDDEDKRQDCLSGMGYLTKIAMQKAIELFLAFGREEMAKTCDNALRLLNTAERKVNRFKQIAGLGVWSGDVSQNNKDVLLRGGAKGLSTFMSYPILTAVATYGEYEAALAMLKEYYGGMLSVGATSFWEDFDLDWLENCGRIDELPDENKVDIHGDKGAFCYTSFRHSLCHGWSAGVVPYLMETVAGIKFEGAGMRRVRIQPNLSGLSHVRVEYPTIYGIMTVEHTLQADGTMKTLVDAPKEIEVL